MPRRYMKVPLAALAVLVLALVASACGSSSNSSSTTGGGDNGTVSAPSAPSGQPGKGKPAVTIGDKNFPEQIILGQLYKQALEARGYTVKLDENIGSSEVIVKALKSGELAGYPEYVGIWLTSVAGDTKAYSSAAASYAAAKKNAEGQGFTMLTPTPFSDVDAIGVTKATAAKYKLSTVEDLKKVKNLIVAGPPEFRNRFTGLVGMKKVYGVVPKQFKPLAIGTQYQALDQNQVTAADVFTTDGQLASGKYVVLKDPRNIFGFQNVAFVVNKKVLAKQGPAFQKTLDAVSKLLTLQAMVAMNKAVTINKQDPKKVAQSFLKANGLLK